MFTFIRSKYSKLTRDKGFFEILTGTAWAMASRIGSTGLALISSVMITRLYGAEAMGILALVTSILSIATVLTVLGTSTSILRLIPEHIIKYSPTSAFKVYRKVQYLVAGASLITGTTLYILSGHIAEGIFKKPHLQGIVAAAAAFILFKSIMLLNQQAVRGLKLIRTYSLLQLLPALGLVIFLVIGLRWKSPNTPAYAQLFAWSVTGILGAIIMDRAFRRRMEPSDPVHHMPIRSILNISLPMLMTASMNIVISQTGIIILGMHRPATEVGYYAVAVRLASLTSVMLAAINTMSAPTFSQLYHSNKIPELLRIARKCSKLVFCVSAPILIFLLIFGRPILSIFKPDFVSAYYTMVILVLGQFVNATSGATGLFMNMTGNQKKMRNYISIAAILNVALNLMFTPRWGATGTAIASLASTTLWNVSGLVFIKLRFGRMIGFIPFVK